ncbi:hypothetical protein BDZ91DRAFT_738587 [Kalaharituber pfeilii]|nr:hypothetical protein BDZ91DRAFT_738587 [Kalaharituber pfeilii]
MGCARLAEFRVVRKNGDEIRLEKEQYEEQLRQALHKKVFEHWVVVVVQVVEYNGLERGRLAGRRA